jgi:DNA-binding CsgD family transcriptional regulator
VTVARLSRSDYRKVLEVVYAAGESGGPIAFSRDALSALRELVPCDVVTFHERSWAPEQVLVYTGEPVGPVTPEIRAAHRRLADEDPLQPASRATRLTDVVSIGAFRRRRFYTEVHRPLGIEYLLWLYLDPQVSDARLEFDRNDGDFDERDLVVLDLVLPQLRRRLRAARGDDAAGALTAREREVVAHVAAGRTNAEIGRALGISHQTVRKHLENVYAKLGVHTRTGALAALKEDAGFSHVCKILQ